MDQKSTKIRENSKFTPFQHKETFFIRNINLIDDIKKDASGGQEVRDKGEYKY